MKKVVFTFALLGAINGFSQNIGINETGNAPDASAILDVESPDKGVLLPRIALSATNVSAPVSSPATSLMVYNTATSGSGATAVTPGFYYWDGTDWIKVISGNTVSTTDNQNLTGATLSGTNLQIDIENGSSTTVNLSSLQDGTGTDSQTLGLSGNSLSISGGNSVTLTDNVNDADFVIGNEYNTGVILNGTDLETTDGGGTITTDLSSLQDGTGTDSQTLGLSGNTLSISGGNSVTLTDNVNDADFVIGNEYNTGFAVASGNLTLTDGGGSISVPLSSLSSGSSDWGLIGNSGTASATNFIGTTDNQALTFRVNNIEKIRIETNGTVSTLNAGNSVFIGEGAGLNDDLSDNKNVFVGKNSGFTTTTGEKNTACGSRTLYYNQTGGYNVACGDASLFGNVSGSFNVGIGASSLGTNSTGINGVAIGTLSQGYANNQSAGWINTNTSVGHSSLRGSSTPANNTGLANTAIGYESLFNNTSGEENTAVGYESLTNNTTGFWNTASGYQALFSNISGSSNIAIGYQALLSNTTGYFNTASGFRALEDNTTGTHNTGFGFQALTQNTTGKYNTAVGFRAYTTNANYSNSSALGYFASITASNQVRLGRNTVTSIGGFVNWTNVSDARFKVEVKENVPGLDLILNLRPVTYHYDLDAIDDYLNVPDSLRANNAKDLKVKIEKESILQTGFIAQEVEEVAKEIGYDFSGVDAPKNEGDYYGLRYAEFVVPLVKSIQEQQKMIEELEAKYDTKINELQAQINELKNK